MATKTETVANGNVKPPADAAKKPEKKKATPYLVMQRIERALENLDARDRDGVIACLFTKYGLPKMAQGMNSFQ